MFTRHRNSESQYFPAIFIWILYRNPCACHTKHFEPQKTFRDLDALYNGFGFRIALPPQPGANFADLNVIKSPTSFGRFWFSSRSLATAWGIFCGSQLQKTLWSCHAWTILTSYYNSSLATAWCIFCGPQLQKNAPITPRLNDFDFRIAVQILPAWASKSFLTPPVVTVIFRNFLKFKWDEIRVMWAPDAFNFTWFQIQYVALKFNWCESRLIWDSTDLQLLRLEAQLISISVGWRFSCSEIQTMWRVGLINGFENQKWSLETKNINIFCEGSSQNAAWPKLFRETSFKNGTLLQDILEEWGSLRSFCARSSCKNEALKLWNETCLRDFLQKWQKRSVFPRLPSRMTCRPDTWPKNTNTL